ncbi:MAG: hypothetical protein H6816_13355 [Phycisphaerales bacterium]|nr:hypothetical protein [Phycisphaerales bacterium]
MMWTAELSPSTTGLMCAGQQEDDLPTCGYEGIPECARPQVTAAFFALASVSNAPILAGGCARPSGPCSSSSLPPVWLRHTGDRLIHMSACSPAAKTSTPQRGRGAGAASRGPRQPPGFPLHTPARSGSLLAVADLGNAGVHLLDLVARTHSLVTGWQEAGVDERSAC